MRFIKWDKLQISGARGPRCKDRRIRCELVSGQRLLHISLSTYLSLSLPFLSLPTQTNQSQSRLMQETHMERYEVGALCKERV